MAAAATRSAGRHQAIGREANAMTDAIVAFVSDNPVDGQLLRSARPATSAGILGYRSVAALLDSLERHPSQLLRVVLLFLTQSEETTLGQLKLVKRGALRSVPVLVIGDTAAAATVAAAYVDGAAGYLQRLPDDGVLRERYATVLDFWLGCGGGPVTPNYG